MDKSLRQFFVSSGIGPCRIVAAVSGGTDSTALLLALSDLRGSGFDILCGHVNHGLRGAESDEDEQFVRALCAQLGVRFLVAPGTLDAQRVRERGVEAAAREARYAALTGMRVLVDARYVATAHQKNDQAETVLMRLLTGGGLAALRGIHPVRGDGFIRPWLGVTREDLQGYLRERGVSARHDHSNDDPRFLRNRVRAMLRDLGGVEQLAALADQARRQWPVLERAIDDADRVCAEASADETRFRTWPEDEWLRGALLQRHIRRLDPDARDFDALRLAAELDQLTRVSVTRHLELIRQDGALVLRRPPVPVEPFEVALTEALPARIPSLGITVRIARPGGQPPSADRQRIQLPGGPPGAFTVRNRRRGDRFQPLGMGSPKKLKDFLIDRKIAADVRDRLPLLIWNGEIAWIGGVEVSERFKVTTAEGELYEVWLEGPGAANDRDHAGFRG